MSSCQVSRGRRGSRELRGTKVHFPTGRELFSPRHPSSQIYRLDAGRVQLASDSEAITDFLGPGEFFGEQCLLDRRQSQVARTLSPVTVTLFAKSELLNLLRLDSRFALGLLTGLAKRMDRYEQSLRDFVREGAERRLALFLRRLAHDSPEKGWVQLPVALTNLELAKTVGTTRWRISHLLSRFRTLGWLRRGKRSFSIHLNGIDEFLKSLSDPPSSN